MSLRVRVARRVGVFAVVSLVAAGMLTTRPLVPSAHASTYTPTLSTFDTRLLYDINHARAARGIRKLVLVAGTTDVAHGWSCHMAAKLLLAHNGSLAYALEKHGSAGWTTYGENVGVEPTTSGADALFRAYMASPEHRANILDTDFRYVGVWTKRASGLRWNTIDFVGHPVSSYNYSYGPTRRTC